MGWMFQVPDEAGGCLGVSRRKRETPTRSAEPILMQNREIV
jgi:hypothetical protein